MPRLTPQRWQDLERVFQALGFVFSRQNGSHRMYKKPGCIRPLVIPAYDLVPTRIIAGLINTAGISRQEFLRLLDNND